MDIEGAPWFVAADVCRSTATYLRADGLVNTSAALAKLPDDEKQNLPYQEAKRIGLLQIASRAYGVSLISESGLYRLVMRSDKPEARAFQDWVTREVLPAIRKDGAYVMGEARRLAQFFMEAPALSGGGPGQPPRREGARGAAQGLGARGCTR